MKNKFCIRTRGPDHSKQIVDTLVRLGYDNTKNRWQGDGEGRNKFYFVYDSIIDYGSLSSLEMEKYIEIQLEDLEGNVRISYNYLML